MAIYRLKSKIFTRAEKELIKQIWRKTNGLRGLPRGVTSLEDARALKDLSRQLDNYGVPVKITPEIRKALDNLGFTKATEGIINRMRTKYSSKNLKARIRLSLMKENRPVDLSKIERGLQRREGQTDRLIKNAREEANQSIQQASQGTADPSLARFYRKKLNGTTIKIDNPAESLSISRIRAGSDLPKLTLEEAREMSVHPIRAKDLRGINRQGGEMIMVSDKSPRSITLHEIGHNKSAREFGEFGKTPDYRYGYIGPQASFGTDGIPRLIEENMASANALDVLKNQKGIRKDKEILDKQLSTYTLELRRKLRR